MNKKVLMIILDGLGDRPILELQMKTPLESANTPNLDALAKGGICGVMNALGRGVRPGSDVSHLAIFGYPAVDYYAGRGPIEVAGLGIELKHGDVAFRANLGTVDDSFKIIDRRAGRINGVSSFTEEIDGIEIDGITVIAKPGVGHRAGIVLRGPGLSSAITDADPHDVDRQVLKPVAKDDSPEAIFTARVVNKLMMIAYTKFNNNPVNQERAQQGLMPANFLLLRGAGQYKELPKFIDKYGFKAACVAGGGLYKGIGAFLGMDIVDVEGATALPDTNLAGKVSTAINTLSSHDFVFLHIKATDSLAEDGNFIGKRDFIEKIDQAVAPLLTLPEGTTLVITADHSTSCALKGHTADPVPILIKSQQVRVDEVNSFNEIACANGGLGHMNGADVMPEVMNLLGKLPIVGA